MPFYINSTVVCSHEPSESELDDFLKDLAKKLKLTKRESASLTGRKVWGSKKFDYSLKMYTSRRRSNDIRYYLMYKYGYLLTDYMDEPNLKHLFVNSRRKVYTDKEGNSVIRFKSIAEVKEIDKLEPGFVWGGSILVDDFEFCMDERSFFYGNLE